MQEISSEESKSLSTTLGPEITTSSPMQEQISFEFIMKCNQALIAVDENISSNKDSKIYIMYDQLINLYVKFSSYFYDLFLKERNLNPDSRFTLKNKFITRKEALEYYQAAKRVFNELEKNGIRPEPVERSLAALRQAVGVTPAEEPEEPEINERTPAISSTVSTDVKPLMAIPESEIGTLPPGIFTFF